MSIPVELRLKLTTTIVASVYTGGTKVEVNNNYCCKCLYRWNRLRLTTTIVASVYTGGTKVEVNNYCCKCLLLYDSLGSQNSARYVIILVATIVAFYFLFFFFLSTYIQMSRSSRMTREQRLNTYMEESKSRYIRTDPNMVMPVMISLHDVNTFFNQWMLCCHFYLISQRHSRVKQSKVIVLAISQCHSRVKQSKVIVLAISQCH